MSDGNALHLGARRADVTPAPASVPSGADGVTVFDSNVMFNPDRRYALLSLVVAEAFTTRWSTDLLGEWTRVIVREGCVTSEQAGRQRTKLIRDFPEAVIRVQIASATLADSVVYDPDDAMIAACA